MTIVSYAQNMEDILLLRALGDVECGFYVDVGAWSPVDDSVTKLFYDKGWSGINVEPVAYWHGRLVDERPRDTNLHVAAGASPGTLTIHVVGETGLSTTDDSLAEDYVTQGHSVSHEVVPVLTLDSILDEHAPNDIHFLKVDVEGAEKDVLQGLDLSRYRPWIMVIESNLPGRQQDSHEAWERIVLAAGYVLAYQDGLNRYYVSNEKASLRKAFRYPPNVFDDFIQYRYSERLRWYADRVAEVQALADAREERLHWYVEHIAEVQALTDGHEQQLDQALKDLVRVKTLTRNLLDRVAPAGSEDEEPQIGLPRLFVDVTMLATSDAGTGIQRVVRNIVAELVNGQGHTVEPVRFVKGQGYVHARAFQAMLDPSRPVAADDPILPLPGDIVLGLDLIADILPYHRDYFDWLRKRGAALWFVVYDLLPVLRPDFFPSGTLGVFTQWYSAIAELATGVVCISQAVSDEFKRWLDQIQPVRSSALQLGYFHLGCDLDRREAPPGVVVYERDLLKFLMVGTIEVRKGHAQVLDAFEQLWERGIEASLRIIGKPGWLSEAVMERLRAHVSQSHRIEWLPNATDVELLEAYMSSGALIMASEGEGYGLPIIEAASHGLPVIARNLPVFREVAGDGAWYFNGTDGASLADAIQHWLELAESGDSPDPDRITRIGWKESARQLMEVIEYGAQSQWRAGTEYAFDASHPEALTAMGRKERNVLASDGRAGYLVYGPYSAVEAGDYDVTVELQAPGRLPPGSLIEVVANDNASPLYRAELDTLDPKGGGLLVKFQLHLPLRVERFQLRILIADCAEVAYVGATLTSTTRSDAYTRALRAEKASVAAQQLAESTAAELAEAMRRLDETVTSLTAANEQAAEAIMALRQSHTQADLLREELRRVELERGRWEEHARLMEQSRSWKLTVPLRTANAFAYRLARRVLRILRPVWHMAVRSKVAASAALVLASPLPPLHRRIRRSINAHRQNQVLSTGAVHGVPGAQSLLSSALPAQGPDTLHAYATLLELRERTSPGSSKCAS